MAEEKILEEGTTIEIEVGEQSAGKTKVKQIRYIFKDPEKGWFEKEKDNVRVTKYYRTQKEAIEAAKTHIKNSGLAGSIVIQSKTGKIRANTKVSKKK
ncbi:MAG: DUF2188 domain-containing protein [Spirochaetes bacterium]|uniref:DUF2188 domain-containing protein n=1 Tax=Candidatus Ornithospirochaeta stercoravium TaxID=2840897 RepID=A0A9D9ICA7_9SPIO|nr:DUF2188 domain-containing protein [Candidatus Ornithospirochaeta stercoravium]